MGKQCGFVNPNIEQRHDCDVIFLTIHVIYQIHKNLFRAAVFQIRYDKDDLHIAYLRPWEYTLINIIPSNNNENGIAHIAKNLHEIFLKHK